MFFILLVSLLSGSILVDTNELSSAEKRSHNHGPDWVDHCWDQASNHLMDPFCALLFGNCSAPPVLEHGSHSKSFTTTLNSTVTYYCDEGYALIGPKVITCERIDTSLQWSKLPVCKRVTCPEIPNIEHGFHENTNGTMPGTTVQYYCMNGYAISDNDTITCVQDSPDSVPHWTQPLPECTGICTLPEVTNGIIVVPGTVFTTMTPEMTFETTVTDAPTTTTDVPDYDNETTSTPDVANETTSNMTDGTNETTTSFPHTFNDTTNFPDTMNATSDLPNDTSDDFTDTTNDAVDVLSDVTDLSSDVTNVSSALANTILSNETTFKINDTIIYRCNAGYSAFSTSQTVVVGNSMESTCFLTTNKTTVWNPSIVCVPECPPVPDVQNANYTAPLNTLEGATVVYDCFTDYEMIGSANVTCLQTGNWSKLPYCRGCGDAPEVLNGTHNTDYKTTINSTVSYVCNEGYSMIGLEVITCEAIIQSPYAKWSTPPYCTHACGPVPSIDNGRHTDPDTILTGANVTYSCLPGFELTGNGNVVCQESGNWTQPPSCQPVCSNPPTIENAVVTKVDDNETDLVKVECEERYTLIGNDTVECINGSWSTPYPYCQCNNQPNDVVFIIDGSGSLGARGFQQTLQFVVDMVSRFPIDITNFGMLTFATDAHLEFYLNEYVNDTIGLTDRIQNTSFPTGGTHTYAGLEFARTDMFQVTNGMRPNISHIAIVVTDGHSDNFNETVDQAELLKNSGVTIYSVGVGLTDENELQLIASNATYVFTVDNYDRIDEIAGPLAGITCAFSSDTGAGQD